MGRFLRALEKAGLVQLDPGEAPAPSPDTPAADVGAADSPAAHDAARVFARPEPRLAAVDVGASAVTSGATTGSVATGGSFEELYAGYGLPSSPFPAEKLLRVLDGLKALEPATRRAAVAAMDAADELWSLADPVLDAQRKAQALDRRAAELAVAVDATRREAQERIAAAEARRDQAATAIRQQISELEQLLARESEKAATEAAQQQAAVGTAEADCARESARLRTESARLGELVHQFAADTGGAAASTATPP